MTRLTLIAFVLLTGFFYVTGKPVDEDGFVINSYAGLAKQKVDTGLHATALLSKDIRSLTVTQPDKFVRSANSLTAGIPDIPVRNPRRLAALLLKRDNKNALASASTPRTTTIKTAALLKKKQNQVFGEARNNFTGASIKPLVVSYRQRYVKTQKPVLGPRLTAVLLKRELRRVGCYSGNITSKWDDDARAAVQHFNLNAGANVAATTPSLATLEHLQQTTKTVCTTKPVVAQTIIASTAPIVSTIAVVKKSTAWRTKVKRRKIAYRAAKPATYRNRNNYKAIGRAKNFDTYEASAARHARRAKRSRRAVKRHRAKRVKRIRVARAKRHARRRTAVRSWKRHYRRKRFGFRRSGGSLSLDD